METKNCPFCGEKVLAAAKKCKHCGEWFVDEKIIADEPQKKSDEHLETEAPDTLNDFSHPIKTFKKSERRNFRTAIIAAVVIFVLAIVVYNVFLYPPRTNQSVRSSLPPLSTTVRPLSEKPAKENNLITSYSIMGVEIFGKTIDELKSEFKQGLTWELVEDQKFRQVYLVKDEQEPLFELNYVNGGVNVAWIYSPDFVTEKGLRVGNPSGDLLKQYPNASFSNGLRLRKGQREEIGYCIIDGKEYVFENYVIDDQTNRLDKNARIKYIRIDDTDAMQQLTTYEKRVLEIKIKYVKKILNEISESQLLLLFNGTNRNKIEKELDGLLLPNNEDDFEEIQRDILDPILFAGMLSKVISDQMEKELEQAEKLKTGEDIRREELRYYLNNWEGC